MIKKEERSNLPEAALNSVPDVKRLGCMATSTICASLLLEFTWARTTARSTNTRRTPCHVTLSDIRERLGSGFAKAGWSKVRSEPEFSPQGTKILSMGTSLQRFREIESSADKLSRIQLVELLDSEIQTYTASGSGGCRRCFHRVVTTAGVGLIITSLRSGQSQRR